MTEDLGRLLAERFGDPMEDLRPKPLRTLAQTALSPDTLAMIAANERTEGQRALRRKRRAG